MPSKDIQLSHDIVKKLDYLSLIRRITSKAGIGLRLVRLESGWHRDDCGVMLGYFGEDKTPAALLPDTPQSYRLITRKNPDGIPVTDEIAAGIAPDAFRCYAGLPSKKLKWLDILHFLLDQTWKTDGKTFLLVSLVAGIIPLITPIITETIFHDIIPILDRQGLSTVTQVAMVSGFTTAALTTVRSIAMLRFSLRGGMAIQAAVILRVLSLPVRFFREYQSGELASRIVGLETVETLLSEELLGTIFSFLFSFWSLALMCWYSWKLTGMAILIWLVYSLISWVVIQRLARSQRYMTQARNKTAGILQQIFTGLVKFRVKGAEAQAYHLWGEKFAEEWKWNYDTRWKKNINTILANVQPILLSLVLYYVGLRELAESTVSIAVIGSEAGTLFGVSQPMTTATFIAFQAAYTAFNASLVACLPVLEQLATVRPLLENLVDILEAEPESADNKIEADMLTGAIEVRNLTFSCRAEGPEVLRDISFRVAAGENVAIVGKSGCGKSTLVRLLLGFESPNSGAVYYDGQDLAELSLASVRSQMGVVLQNGQLMTGDIFHNIVGTNDLTLDDAWEAAEAAGVADDIREMPMQMNTIISEGSTNISGGQRQRLLIARALAMKPAIILCDEATSALDNQAQAIVTASLDRLKATRIVVAHRLSTIRHADRILVLDEGRIAESGTFDELVARDGLFASLAKRQTI
ncbi:MAG: NHLP bacteriocin export ABC transporter permease/ATPase subunit [Schwartzia sp.]|nr:NHLP bacteriocin export ABC transporter permease/ATPase subunit [Schwartzia sp. (in: firmicutes)]